MNKKDFILVLLTTFLLVSFSGCVDPGETTEESPEFEVSDLEVSPSQIKTGEVTTVVATVTNVGEEAGSHTIDLIINGEAVDQKNLNIEANDSTEVTFEVIRDQVGEFTVEIGDLSDTFEVTEEIEELELTEFEFISEETGEPIDGAYKSQDEVNMDFKVENFEAENELIDYTVKITVRDPDGDIYEGLNEYTILDQTKEVSENKGYVEVDSWISPSDEGWDVGENKVTFKVTDQVSGRSIRFSEIFEVSDSSPEFEIKNLKLGKDLIGKGQHFEVYVDVENIGESEGVYQAALQIDSEQITKEETIKPGETKTITFDVVKNEVGEFTVEIGDLSDTFEVTEEIQELELNAFSYLDNVTEEPTNPVYGSKDEVYAGFSVDGFEVSGDGVVDWEYYVTVVGPSGEPVEGFNRTLVADDEAEVGSNKTWQRLYFGPKLRPIFEDWGIGNHTVIYEVVDEVGEKSMEFNKTFEVVEEVEELELIGFDFIDFETFEVTEPVYEPQDDIYSQFSVDGFEVSGDGVVEWEYYVTVVGPSGEPVEGFNRVLLENDTAEVSQSKSFDEVNFSPYLPTIYGNWSLGNHTMKYEVIDKVSKKSIEFNKTFEVVKGLELTEFNFIDDETGEPTEAVYNPSESVNMSFRVKDFEAQNGVIDYNAKITVRNPNGEVYGVLDEYTILDQTKEVSEDERYVEVDSWTSPPDEGWIVGENTVTFKVTDEVGEKSIEFTKTFEVSE